MSLKSKIEAVIYAAEEPVTLAQLTALFAAEALEWKAAQDAASAASSASDNESLPAVNAEFDYSGPDSGPEPAAEIASELDSEQPQESDSEPAAAAEAG